MPSKIYTIGHSSHDLSTFFSILKRYNIDEIVDIRRSPRSSAYPHFNRDHLENQCTLFSLKYSFHGDKLGGRRRRRKSIATLNNDVRKIKTKLTTK